MLIHITTSGRAWIVFTRWGAAVALANFHLLQLDVSLIGSGEGPILFYGMHPGFQRKHDIWTNPLSLSVQELSAAWCVCFSAAQPPPKQQKIQSLFSLGCNGAVFRGLASGFLRRLVWEILNGKLKPWVVQVTEGVKGCHMKSWLAPSCIALFLACSAY